MACRLASTLAADVIRDPVQGNERLSEENIMLRFIFVSVVVLVAQVTQSFASEGPDLTVTWMVKVEGVKLQKSLGSAPQDIDAGPQKTGAFEFDLTVIIDRQEGHGFSGMKTSARTSEPISGVLDFDNTRVFMVDNDGTTTCTLVSPVEMNCVYLEVNAVNSIAARSVYIRQD
ncbi:MAG: hypothetical protein GY791_02305 [Alphaproteobacteria bacterium]|nr:hypothetical protein [Alphaproteobacteria bacterium]